MVLTRRHRGHFYSTCLRGLFWKQSQSYTSVALRIISHVCVNIVLDTSSAAAAAALLLLLAPPVMAPRPKNNRLEITVNNPFYSAAPLCSSTSDLFPSVLEPLTLGERPHSAHSLPTPRYRKNVKEMTGFLTTEEEFEALPIAVRRKVRTRQHLLPSFLMFHPPAIDGVSALTKLIKLWLSMLA